MPLQYFDFKKDDTRLVKCDDTVYKVKILPQGSLQSGLPCSLQSAHKQIEDVFRAMLYMDQRSVLFKPIHTVDFIINTKKKRWKTCEKLSFQINGRPLKACPYQFILKVNLKNKATCLIQSESETITVSNHTHDCHVTDVQVRHDKDATRSIKNSDLCKSGTWSKTTHNKRRNSDNLNVSMVTGGEKSKRKSVDEEKDPKEIVQKYKNIHTSVNLSAGEEAAVRNETSHEENDEERNRQILREKIRERERKKNEELRKKQELNKTLNKVFNESVISKGANKRRKLYNSEVYCKTPMSATAPKYNTRNSVKLKDGVVNVSHVKSSNNVKQTGTNNDEEDLDRPRTTLKKDSQEYTKSTSRDRGKIVSPERDKSNSPERLKSASPVICKSTNQTRDKHYEDVVDSQKELRLELRKIDEQDLNKSRGRELRSDKNQMNSGYTEDEFTPQRTTRYTRSGSSERSRKSTGRKLKQSVMKNKLKTVREVSPNPQVNDALYSVKPISRITLSKSTRSTPRKSSGKSINRTLSSTRRESARLQKLKVISPVKETVKSSQESTSSSSSDSSQESSCKVTKMSIKTKQYPLRSRTQSLSPYRTKLKGPKTSSYRRSYRTGDKNNSSGDSPKIDLFRPLVLGNESERLEKLKTTTLDKRRQRASRQQLDRHEIEKEEVREYMKLQKMSKSGSPVKSPRHSPRKRKSSGFWDIVEAIITPVKRVFKG